MTAVSFPILRLPESALQESLKLMSIRDRLSVSVLSKKAKRLFTVVNKNPITAVVSMTSTSFCFNSRPFQHFQFVLNSDKSNVEIRKYSRNGYKWTYLNVPGFAEKQWFKHITDVFFRNQCTILIIENSPGRSIEEICECTKKLKIVELRVDHSKIQNYQVLELLPSLKKLKVRSLEGPNPKSILTQSLESIDINSLNVTLDDLLALNHTDFTLHTQSCSDSDMNLFLKHWIKGSHSNLKSLAIYIFKYIFKYCKTFEIGV
ncbi:F-box domain-containing protein [Caenorhabditis elegans]|uniref:F-box domain-containing protein n=1 Tax=Caenorhabditis elegans TaxID=6239 RepID=A0A0S4XRX8_CAEEL|nr:F-box domain-containing protein [Caenorhabditis elegans]CUV67071.1 F-box domain-containing protein [Caenorhabditis elegans]|eukprot:NP_001305218.1 Uncharacterized protein CELE_F45D11.7 [Caenorhabditis elegans]